MNNISRVEIYRVSVKNTGTIYEADRARAFAWSLYDLLMRRESSDNPNYGDCLTIVKNSQEVINLLTEYQKYQY